jgi:hypothetical protein
MSLAVPITHMYIFLLVWDAELSNNKIVQELCSSSIYIIIFSLKASREQYSDRTRLDLFLTVQREWGITRFDGGLVLCCPTTTPQGVAPQ